MRHAWEMINTQAVYIPHHFIRKPNVTDNLGYPGISERIILKWTNSMEQESSSQA
jgi:hypothetical protein